MNTNIVRFFSVLIFLFAFFGISTAVYAQCAGNVVSNNMDSGANSLRDCVAAGGTINVTTPGPIVLTTGEITFTSDTTILGNGVTVNGSASGRIFSTPMVAPVLDIEINDMVLTNGDGTGAVMSGSGGAILNYGHNMTLDCVTINLNNAINGGGVYTTSGVGSGLLVVRDSTISNNTASAGGGFFFSDSDGNISKSTISGNTVTVLNGGGMQLDSQSTVTVINSTVCDNSAAGFGGGIRVNLNSILGLIQSTVADNQADSDGASTTDGGGLSSNAGSTINTTSSLLLSNTSGMGLTLNNCSSALNSDTGGSRADDATCAPIVELSPITGVSTTLSGAFGKTEVKEVMDDSNIIGLATVCQADDQTNFLRSQPCEPGAFEARGTATQIQITKVAVPASGASFGFMSDLNAAGISCSSSGSAVVAGDGSFSLGHNETLTCNVPPGTYNVSEDLFVGSDLSIGCLPPGSANIVDRNAQINIASGEVVSCTFTNTEEGATSGSSTSSSSSSTTSSTGGGGFTVCAFEGSFFFRCILEFFASDGENFEIMNEIDNGSGGGVFVKLLETLGPEVLNDINNLTIEIFEEDGLNIENAFLEPGTVGDCQRVVQNDPFPLEETNESLRWVCTIPFLADPSIVDLFLDVFVSGVETQEPQGQRTIRYVIDSPAFPSALTVVQTVNVSDVNTGCTLAKTGTRNMGFFAVLAVIPGIILLRIFSRRARKK